MFGRNARKRREYLYRNSIKTQERQRLERNIRIREALESGTPIAEKDFMEKLKEDEYGIDYSEENERIEKVVEDLDNEYKNVRNRKILISSQRDCSILVKQFIRELKFVIPNCQKMNRGKRSLPNCVEIAINEGFTDFILIKQNPKTGRPDGMILTHLPYGPSTYFTLFNVVMRHDIRLTDPISQAFPHLIFHNFGTKLGSRVVTILKYLFPVPKKESKRVLTFANNNDYISFRHHTYEDKKNKIELSEVGPRFEMLLFKITLGTMDKKDADVEWQLGVFKNSYSKVQKLGGKRNSLENENENVNDMVFPEGFEDNI